MPTPYRLGSRSSWELEWKSENSCLRDPFVRNAGLADAQALTLMVRTNGGTDWSETTLDAGEQLIKAAKNSEGRPAAFGPECVKTR